MARDRDGSRLRSGTFRATSEFVVRTGAWLGGLWACLLWLSCVPGARAQELPTGGAQGLGFLELTFTPVSRAQIAIWVEHDGVFEATVRLTEAVAYRGLGNRPGAAQMNSGFRWPYGRREGVLPVWARRRASQPGAQLFRRVIFQNRASEGNASRTVEDSSPDAYYCLQWDRERSRKDALDAVSCASVFNSDKGRYITEQDIEKGYAEPYAPPGTDETLKRPLSLTSLYPPRRDVTLCTSCADHPDIGGYQDDVRAVMPDIDAVTMATPVGDAVQHILYPIPNGWEPGVYRACIEINVEGDYNFAFNDDTYPTPTDTVASGPVWDPYALGWGYPFRGQPSVVYCTDIEVGGDEERRVTTDQAAGTPGSWDLEDPNFGELREMSDMTTDPVGAPGSGGDRLQLMEDGYRLAVVFKPSAACATDAPPSAVGELSLSRYHDVVHAHEWAHLHFTAASDDIGIYRYDVRVSTAPIVDDASFMAGTPAKQASLEAPELVVPTSAEAGQSVDIDLGGLSPLTHYYVGVRALDACAASGPLQVAEITTPKRTFATVTPCFVATAAFGSPLAHEIGALRRMRDRQLLTNPIGRALVAGYYALGPRLADMIRPHDSLRALTRELLRPLIALAHALD